MVVPLKLTQFYGSSVPRPRIYAALKVSDQRVDPPLSVNDALLSWASDAHWSMGGLSFQRSRAQGKLEGSARRLRAFLEEDEDAPAVSEKGKAVKEAAISTPVEIAGLPAEASAKLKPTAVKETGRSLERKKHRSEEESVKISGLPAEASGKLKPTVGKETCRSPERKKHRSEEESVEATPARKHRKRGVLGESSEEDSPVFVPATEEKSRKKLRAESDEVVSGSVRKEGLRLPSKAELLEVETPKGGRHRGKPSTPSGKTLHVSKPSSAHGKLLMDSSPASKGGRSTRSGNKKTVCQDLSLLPLQSPPKGKPRAGKILSRATDKNLSERDDGLDAVSMRKRRSLMQISCLVSDSDSEQAPLN